MSKYINIKEDEIKNLVTNRLLNIYRINRKYIFQTLFLNGFDPNKNINWFMVNDELWYHSEFNRISYLNSLVKEELDIRDD